MTQEAGNAGSPFFAAVPQHGRATYLIFQGNSLAELPNYVTDLLDGGQGYGLQVANRHYVAHLSEQMGQLERLIFRRELRDLNSTLVGRDTESLRALTGPMITSTRAASRSSGCGTGQGPNFEVEIGPLLVWCRRWGFPHSPVHPLFTPSRIHVDQTYSFFAGLPYFLKDGRMDAIQDVTVAAMRDDECVFSGYSFTDTLWIDHSGKLHEGPVRAEAAQNLWRVGFRNRISRDAFVTLWLEYRAEGFDGIGHNGTTTLDYPGHGQLWSRYPVQPAQLQGRGLGPPEECLSGARVLGRRRTIHRGVAAPPAQPCRCSRRRAAARRWFPARRHPRTNRRDSRDGAPEARNLASPPRGAG